jgi:alginate O-acetyltransferase complex protein AlgI
VLFNSYAFLCGFLPLALMAFFALGRSAGGRLALPIITGFSLAFYAYWDWRNLGVLVPSLLVNFIIGRSLSRRARKPVLVAGLVMNLSVLGVFKYADFALGTVNVLAGAQLPLVRIALPLGISFFTFEQIAYIVDAYRGRAREYSFPEYAFFVTFFPHLIAGPIIQHDELLNQTKGDLGRKLWMPRAENLALGAAFLIIGLFKKVVIADHCAPYVSPYDRVALGFTPTFLEAWTATFGYSLQLYFDFSGYSDMAIGLARMLNLRLPENFASPYKAHNPIEFWRRWHMTLSRFLRVYLYIPLGGNRGSTARRYWNIFITMALGGLWHGAGWGFVLWGSINGVYLIINNAFRALRGAPRENAPEGPSWVIELCRTWTFFLIMISRVFFRAPDLASAWTMLKSMFTLSDLTLARLSESSVPLAGFAALYLFCRVAPNSQQVFAHLEPVVGEVLYPSQRRLALSPSTALMLAAMAVSSFLWLNHVSTFLYFQF